MIWRWMARFGGAIVALTIMIYPVSHFELEAADGYTHVLYALSHDSAYKVRMRAVEILAQRVRKKREPPPSSVIAALGEAATTDGHRLVRGAACVALGKMADSRARVALQHAKADPEPFVRAQAEDALRAIAAAAADPELRRRIVLSVQVDDDPEAAEQVQSILGQALTTRAQGWVVGGPGAGQGVRVRAIAELRSHPESMGHRVTMQVRLSLSTWPDDALRQVFSAEASAVQKNPAPSRALYNKLLQAASERAADDVWAHIQGD